METTPELNKALAAVMGEITTLKKNAVNKHGNYKYTSIDDFLDAVRPICAKHGLSVMQDEISEEIREGSKGRDGEASAWLHIKYRFGWRHASGETLDCGVRTAMANAKMGAQAYMAAESYGMKRFLRTQFMIATGENVADEGVLEPGRLPPKNSRSADWKGPLVKGKLQECMKSYILNIQEAATLEELNELGENIALLGDESPNGSPIKFKEVVEQCRHDMPGWLNGDGMPELFVSFNSHMDAALDRLGANGGDE